MTKRTLSHLSVLAVLIVFLATCTKTAEYTNVIPADATVAGSINLKSLAVKAGLNDSENEALKQQLLGSLKSGLNAEAFAQMEKVMANPAESGVDVESPIYFFLSPSFPVPVAVAKVSDKAKLEACMTAANKEQIMQPIVEVDGYSFATTDGGFLAFNETTLIAAPNGNQQEDAIKTFVSGLMKQTADNSIASSEAFRKMEKLNGDFKGFASMDAIPEPYKGQASMGLPSGIELKDIILIGGVSFNNGEIVAEMENYTENDSVKALMEEQKEYVMKTNNVFVKNFPASTLMFINMGVKGEGLYKMIAENKALTEKVSANEKKQIESMKDIFNSFDGDITLGLTDVNLQSGPVFLAFAEVKDKAVLDTLAAKANMTKTGENEYTLSADRMTFFVGMKDNHLYATNSAELHKNIGQAAEKSIEEAVYAPEMKGKMSFVAINAEAVLALPALQMVAQMGGQQAKVGLDVASKISYLSGSSEGETSVLKLSLKDKDTNALKQIVDLGKQYGSAMGVIGR